tara:strand:- start:306 stop:476 length:171 start_codon:yes stop_codon:yes gene_type:complete
VVVTPFRFFMLIWATLFGYLFFAHIPRIDTFIGQRLSARRDATSSSGRAVRAKQQP